MPDRAYISIQNVSKHFGSIHAVDQVSLEIQKGEFFGLLGSSGCGKTTLLRMLAGFETLTMGEIYIDNEATTAIPHYQRPVNMVFQSYAIFPHLNVFQNIAFGLRKDRLSKRVLADRVNEALALIKLEGYGKRGANELSGGQRQRVALARALIKKPKVLLLDEPMGALDKKLREQMQLELRQLQKGVGITFVFVTHDQEEALSMSDRIAVMSNGKVLEVGSPTDLYERPTNRFVASFLGAMNLMEGEIKSRRGTACVVETDRLGLLQADAPGQDFAPGEKISVGIRPENISILPATSADVDPEESQTVQGVITNMAYLGDRSHIYVTIPTSPEPLLVARQNLDGVAANLGSTDADIFLSWSPSSVLLLKTSSAYPPDNS